MIHSTLLPALLAMGATEPVALTTYAPLEPSIVLAPRADDVDESVFSYSYIEIGATQYNVDNDALDEDADTYNAELSFGLFKIFNIFLGYETRDFDNLDVDYDTWTLGAGVHFSLGPKLDLTGDLAWIGSAFDGEGIDEDTNDVQLRLGARWMLLHRESWGLEAFGRAVAVSQDEIDEIDRDDSAVGFDLGARLHFAKRFSVAAEYSMLEDEDQVGLSARFSF